MTFFKICKVTGKVIAFSSAASHSRDGWDTQDAMWISIRDISSLEQAEAIAAQMSTLTNEQWLAGGEGRNFNVIVAPKIGDKVSRSFNGDSYPEGEIIRITPTWRIVTSTGTKFSRRQNSCSWKPVNGYGSMIAGHVYEQNPHF